VVAAATAGVLDAAGIGQSVTGLVQQGAEHVDGAALEAFAADQDLVAVGAVDLPAVGGEVAQIQPLALGAGSDHDDYVRHVGVSGADGLPGVLQGPDQEAGRPVRGGVVGWLVHQGLPFLMWAGRVLTVAAAARPASLAGGRVNRWPYGWLVRAG
jgi:hypothetical protein